MSPKVVLYIQEDKEGEVLVSEFKRWAMAKGIEFSIKSPESLNLPSGVSSLQGSSEASEEKDSDMWVSGQNFQLMENRFSMSSHTKKQKILSMEEVEAQVIKEAIQAYEGNLSQVSRKLKIGRATLYRKLKQYDITASEWVNGFKKAA